MPLTKTTPARRLAHAIEARATEAHLIFRLIDMADRLAGEASAEDLSRWREDREELTAVLKGAGAMMGDLVEELGHLQDFALALQDGPSSPPATGAPAAA